MKRQSLISVLAACLCLLVASSAFAGTCEFDKKAVLAGLGELPSSLDELASLTRIERSVAMSELDSFTKARLWREHLAAQVDGMNLSSDQLAVIEHASSLISPKLFEANRGDLMFEAVVEKPVEGLMASAEKVFDRDELTALFHNIGGQSLELPTKAANCSCNTGYWFSCGSCASGGCNYIFIGCGPFLLWPCDGKC